MADGEWLSATMADFKKDHSLEIVYENGRPSYFQEKTSGLHEPIDGEHSASSQASAPPLDGHSADLNSSTEAIVGKPLEMVEEQLRHQPFTPASSCTDECGEVKIIELARTLSYHGIKNEKGEFVNPFLGSEHPLLDPSSDKFSSKAWLETLMSIASRDPVRYPKRTAGVAYKNLSAHGFGEPTDYQKTFGNYPFVLLNLARRLVGKGRKTRIQILRDFDGLIKSGEMLVVLGRPGRQVLLQTNTASVADKLVAVRRS